MSGLYSGVVAITVVVIVTIVAFYVVGSIENQIALESGWNDTFHKVLREFQEASGIFLVFPLILIAIVLMVLARLWSRDSWYAETSSEEPEAEDLAIQEGYVVCAYCRTKNEGDAGNCSYCGAPLGDSK